LRQIAARISWAPPARLEGWLSNPEMLRRLENLGRGLDDDNDD
jgi:hypothetical protein